MVQEKRIFFRLKQIRKNKSIAKNKNFRIRGQKINVICKTKCPGIVLEKQDDSNIIPKILN